MKLTLAALVAISGLLAAPAYAQDANAIISSIGGTQFVDAAGQVSSATSARVERLSTYLGSGRSADRLARALDRHQGKRLPAWKPGDQPHRHASHPRFGL